MEHMRGKGMLATVLKIVGRKRLKMMNDIRRGRNNKTKEQVWSQNSWRQ